MRARPALHQALVGSMSRADRPDASRSTGWPFCPAVDGCPSQRQISVSHARRASPLPRLSSLRGVLPRARGHDPRHSRRRGPLATSFAFRHSRHADRGPFRASSHGDRRKRGVRHAWNARRAQRLLNLRCAQQYLSRVSGGLPAVPRGSARSRPLGRTVRPRTSGLRSAQAAVRGRMEPPFSASKASTCSAFTALRARATTSDD